jgi:hypothetical protein
MYRGLGLIASAGKIKPALKKIEVLGLELRAYTLSHSTSPVWH